MAYTILNNPASSNVSASTVTVGPSLGAGVGLGLGLASNSSGPIWTSPQPQGALQVSGDASISGTLKVGKVNVTELLEQIQDRLAILVPNPALLEKYEALQEAYEHYKTLEALCVDADKTDR